MADYNRGTRIGPFKLEKLLADSGGMSLVWEASVDDPSWDGQKGKRVALKIARNNQENEYVYEQLLRTETKRLRDMRHPGIIRTYPIPYSVRCLPFGRARDLPGAPWYFAMELLEGGTMNEILNHRRFNDLHWQLELIYQLAVTLDYIHLRTVAHRDLKPDNVMFRTQPNPKETPTPVLIDFGLAEKHQIDPEVNAASLSHASPERVRQLRGSSRTQRQMFSGDHRADDVWALGIIAYELITGEHPFAPLNVYPTALAQKIESQSLPSMSRDVPVPVKELLYSMLEKDPKRRISIAEVLDWLDGNVDFVSPRI